MGKAKKKPAQVKPGKATKTDEAIAISTTAPPQVGANKPSKVDKPTCHNCGESEKVRNKGFRHNKHEPKKRKWHCESCNERWAVDIDPVSNN